MTAAGRALGRGGHGLLEQLMAVVRPEFRTEIYIPAPAAPVFAAGKCAVAGCDRTAVQRGLCNGHVIRWRQRGRPAVEDFLADSGPPVRGRITLARCKVDRCRYGRGGGGLCSRHRDRWDRAGTPDLATGDAPELVTPGARPSAACRFALCGLRIRRRSSAAATMTGGSGMAGPIPAGSSPIASSPARPTSICAAWPRS